MLLCFIASSFFVTPKNSEKTARTGIKKVILFYSHGQPMSYPLCDNSAMIKNV